MSEMTFFASPAEPVRHRRVASPRGSLLMLAVAFALAIATLVVIAALARNF